MSHSTPILSLENIMNNQSYFDISTNATFTSQSTEQKCLAMHNWREVLMMMSFLFVFILGVFGNLLILLAFIPRLCSKRPNSSSHLDLLIVYLGFCDLLASVFGPIVFIYWISTCYKRWDFGIIGCKIIPSLSRIAVNISIGVVLIMAVDRCYAITAVTRRRKINSWIIHASVAAVVFLSTVSESYYINSIKQQVTANTTQCVLVPVVRPTYSIPLVVITCVRDLLFVVIFVATTMLSIRKLKLSTTGSFLGAFKEKRTMNNARTIKLLMTMAGVFTLLVIPRDLLHLAFTISWMKWPEKQGIDDT